MDHPTAPSCWREKMHAAGNTFIDVDPCAPAFEHLITAMRAEFLRALAAIEQLRSENHLLRVNAGTAAQRVADIETHIGPFGKVAGGVPGRLVSDEGPLPMASAISFGETTPISSAKSDLVRIVRTEQEPCIGWDSEVNVPSREQPIIPSSSLDLPIPKSSADADEGKFPDVHDMDSAEARVDLEVDRRISKTSTSSKVSALTVLDVWRGKPKRVVLTCSGGKRYLSRELSMEWGSVRAGDDLKEDSVFQPFVLHPGRATTWAWDTVVTLAAVYDLVIMPLQVIALMPVSMYAMDLTTACVWTLDILVGCLRGRDIGGVVDMRPSKIAKGYLRTWFVLDAVLCATDWVLVTTISTKLDVVRSIRLRRTLRLLRLMRILRITKILRSFRRMRMQMPTSDYIEAFSSVIKFLFTMLLVNHYIACGWYAVGNAGIEPSWITTTFNESDSFALRYSTAYHWSLTQVTPASMEVVPTNVFERAYNVGAIFFGLVMFTSFVSHMTAAVARMQQLNAATDKQLRDLRNYAQQHRVSFGLGTQIEAYIHTANKRMKLMRILESDIAILRMLPEFLLNKLREEVFTPTLCAHPFFEKFKDVERSAFVSICNVAAAEKHVVVGEELFRCGQVATKTYFTTSGGLSYFEGFHGYDSDDVPEGSWFSEATLWCKWTHNGRMMACDGHAEIVTVDAAETIRMMSATASFYQVQRYAKMYCMLAVDEGGSTGLIKDTWGGSHWVATAVQHAWAPSVHYIISLMWQSNDNWYVNAFHAWKSYTAAAVKARLQSAGFLTRAVVPLVATMRRHLPLARRSLS